MRKHNNDCNLNIHVERVENGFIVIIGRGTVNNGYPVDRFVFNSITEVNNFINGLTGEWV